MPLSRLQKGRSGGSWFLFKAFIQNFMWARIRQCNMQAIYCSLQRYKTDMGCGQRIKIKQRNKFLVLLHVHFAEIQCNHTKLEHYGLTHMTSPINFRYRRYVCIYNQLKSNDDWSLTNVTIWRNNNFDILFSLCLIFCCGSTVHALMYVTYYIKLYGTVLFCSLNVYRMTILGLGFMCM